MSQRCPAKLKMIAINTTVLPDLVYVYQVQSPHTLNLKTEIGRVHRKAIRWAYQLKKLQCHRTNERNKYNIRIMEKNIGHNFFKQT